MNKRIAIIGLGNTLRHDDGIGIIILESLRDSHKAEGIDYLNFGIASIDLLHRLKEYDIVLLIDGINAGLACAELKIYEAGKIKYDFKNTAVSSHELNLKDLFELCKKYNIKAKVYLAGIQVKDTSFGEGLSEELKNKQAGLTKEIDRFIGRIRR